MAFMIWLAQSGQENRSLPAWWPIVALAVPLLVALIVAIIQATGAIKSAKIAAEAKAAIPPDKIAEEVARVLGEELDRRLGTETMAEAQAAFDRGRQEAEAAARDVIEAHERAIQELQAQLAARETEPVGGQSEKLAAAMLYNAGWDVHRAGTLGEAIGLYSAAIKLDPNYARAFYNRANAKYDMGDKRGAIEDYNEAFRLDPTDSKALYNCANAKSDLNNHRGAIEDYTESIRLDPTFAHAYYNRGNSKSALEDGPGATEDYQAAIRLDPTLAAAFYNIACEAAKVGDVDRAIESLRDAIELDARWAKPARTDPDFAQINDTSAFRALFDHVAIPPPQPS